MRYERSESGLMLPSTRALRRRTDALYELVRGCYAQDDQSIANAAGATVRADINANLQALVTLSSGAAAPSTTWAYMWWADTTTGLLKIRNAANSAWITVGTLATLTFLMLTGGTISGNLVVQGNTTLGDNSADVLTVTSDKLVSSLTGGFNYPLQSCFSAYRSSAQNNVTGTGTQATIVCNTELFDQNADYDTSTGEFTAPVTGRYLFSAGAYLTGCTIATSFQLYIVTSNRSWTVDYKARAASNADMQLNGTVLLDMDAGDTAKIQVAVSGEAGDTVDIGSHATNPVTFFTGQLLA